MDTKKKEKIKNGMNSLIVAIIYIAFGVLMILFPGVMANIVCILIAAALLVFGALKLLAYFRKDKEQAAQSFDLVGGVILLILGVLILLFQRRFLNILPILFGIFLLISALIKLQNAFDVKRFGGEKWWMVLLFSVVSIVLAILLIARPGFMVKASFIVIGIFLLIDGIETLIGTFMLGKTTTSYKKAQDEFRRTVEAEHVNFYTEDDKK